MINVIVCRDKNLQNLLHFIYIPVIMQQTITFPELCSFFISIVYCIVTCIFVQTADSEWTPLWVPLKSARSSLTSSVAMSTSMSTRHPPSHWTTPRCFSPMLAWTRYIIHASPRCSQISVPLYFRMVHLYVPTDLQHFDSVLKWEDSCSKLSINTTHKLAPYVCLPLSLSPSSSTPSTRPTLWPSCVVPPTLKSVSVQVANTTTWMMWVKMSTTTPSSRCWGPGPLVTTLRYYTVILCSCVTFCHQPDWNWISADSGSSFFYFIFLNCEQRY